MVNAHGVGNFVRDSPRCCLCVNNYEGVRPSSGRTPIEATWEQLYRGQAKWLITAAFVGSAEASHEPEDFVLVFRCLAEVAQAQNDRRGQTATRPSDWMDAP